jgi:Trm5-related predicted tRNA methylase
MDASASQQPSKNSLKKLAKRARIEQKYAEEKRQKKMQKHSSQVSESQQQSQSSSSTFSWRSERKRMEREDSLARSSKFPTILFDCDFGQFMSEKEEISLHQQIMFCYGILKKYPQTFMRCFRFFFTTI